MKNHIGQINAWNTVKNAILPAWTRGETRFLIVEGRSGIGKTHFSENLTAELEEIQEFGLKQYYDTASDLNRVKVDPENPMAEMPIDYFAGLLERSAMGEKVLAVVDEAHLIGATAASFAFFNPLILGAGKGWQGTGNLLLRGKEIPFNRENLFLVFLTNHKNKIMGGGNEEAISRRATAIKLEKYSDSDMRELIPLYMEEKGMEFADTESVGDKRVIKNQLVKVHRGTFQALDAFRAKVDCKAITKESAMQALKSIPWTLRGFTWPEIKALKVLAKLGKARQKTVVESIPEGDNLNWTNFISYAKGQTVKMKDGSFVETPFVHETGGVYYLTETGEQFLAVNADWLNK